MKLGAAVLIGLSAVATMSACRREEKKTVASEALLTPLGGAPVVALPVPGFGDAVVDVPVGTTRASPVVVAVLGIGDTPESQCSTWRELLEGRAFVVCPRGEPHWVQLQSEESDASTDEQAVDVESAPEPRADAQPQVRQVGFYPPNLDKLDREVDAALSALRARYPKHVLPDGTIYAGFSRGAFLGASLAARHPGRFRRAILIEGGQSPWTDEVAAAFATGGGERVLFACGQPSCVEEAKTASGVLGRRKIQTRIVHGEGEGHGYKRQVKDEVRKAFDWVTEGDARWRQAFADRATYK